MALPLILASASPRRGHLLKYLTSKFEIHTFGSKEPKRHPKGPVALARQAARIKAVAALRRHPGRVILAADTIVVLDRRVFGKPLTASKARLMLSKLSGRTHRVITAVAVAPPRAAIAVGHSTSNVKIRKLMESEIRGYVRDFRPLDKAGAYAVQDGIAGIVESYKGCLCNIIGLPLLLTAKLLAKAAVSLRGKNCPYYKICAKYPRTRFRVNPPKNLRPMESRWASRKYLKKLPKFTRIGSKVFIRLNYRCRDE